MKLKEAQEARRVLDRPTAICHSLRRNRRRPFLHFFHEQPVGQICPFERVHPLSPGSRDHEGVNGTLPDRLECLLRLVKRGVAFCQPGAKALDRKSYSARSEAVVTMTQRVLILPNA